jgi:hypothetical protein
VTDSLFGLNAGLRQEHRAKYESGSALDQKTPPSSLGRHLIHVNPGDLQAWFQNHLALDV